MLSGPGEIVGAAGLKATSGTGAIVVEAMKSADDLYLVQTAMATVAATTSDLSRHSMAMARDGDDVLTGALAVGWLDPKHSKSEDE